MSFDPDWDSNDLFRQLRAERALADDLADELRETVVAWKAALREPTTVAAGLLADRLEGVHRVEARYREARGR